jgi:hypothetical protein
MTPSLIWGHLFPLIMQTTRGALIVEDKEAVHGNFRLFSLLCLTEQVEASLLSH